MVNENPSQARAKPRVLVDENGGAPPPEQAGNGAKPITSGADLKAACGALKAHYGKAPRVSAQSKSAAMKLADTDPDAATVIVAQPETWAGWIAAGSAMRARIASTPSSVNFSVPALGRNVDGARFVEALDRGDAAVLDAV